MKKLIFREATIYDIDDYMIVRMAVLENVLNTPELVTKEVEIQYLTVDGKGWVCELEGKIVGFAVIALKQRNLWALFVHPDYERMRIGKTLHDLALDWYFSQTNDDLWLTTAPKTRAEAFYRKFGWHDKGHAGNEIKFEMTFENYQNTLAG